MIRRFAFAALCASLSACNATQAPGPVASSAPTASAYANLPVGVSPPGFRLPDGAGCAGAVARYTAIMDNDLNSGHTSQSVYDRIKGEIAQASAACSAGREAEAEGLIRASKARHGYPQG
ncbi:hypothetical protein [Alsobacter sp. SYSU BS001988]|jgi:hypothetical protein